MSFRRDAFTLLEICLALLIGLTLVLLAVPSVGGLLAEQRLKQSFERFDRLVGEAKRRSVNEQRVWRIVWDREEITLGTAERDAAPGERLVRAKDETFRIERPAALQKNAPPEWVFWPNGTCEPALISFAGPAGTWQARYDPLTTRGVFLHSDTR